MAQVQPSPPNLSADRKRVKVYELKNNDWYDRGTGFCTGQIVPTPGCSPENPDGRILVVSEEDPNRTLLETRITKDDGYQKQQETLIVWTESNGIDMALSFQEAEGCAGIWEFVSDVQGRLAALAPDDNLSDDLLDPPVHPVVLPEPQLGQLDQLERAIREALSAPGGRDALTKFIMHPDHMYILKLCPLVELAEELHSLPDLHKLCTIMKHLILLNDTAVIEFIVTDAAMYGVVGALEYDPDFPSHRANHRQYLSDTSKFKEVVPIQDEDVRRKIHWTYRLLYMKDVVLARILDDPTFSVLNSLIFFHQVDIVNHLQANHQFLKDLFDIFATPGDALPDKKRDGVLFIQNCCAISKNIQAQSRAQLYQNFINNGLFTVITFALGHHDAAVRVAGTDILVALIDHDSNMVRSHIFNAIKEKGVPLTDTLISLLLIEVDLGVKSQMADAIKILLDPNPGLPGMDMMNRAGMGANVEIMAKRGGLGAGALMPGQQANTFIDNFYDTSAKRLFAPLKALEHRESMANLSAQEISLYTHLTEILCFFVRNHTAKSKTFILSEHLHNRVAQLFACPVKHMKLAALRWFRTCIGLQDEWHNRQIITQFLFDPIFALVEATMPRDNLLNSACLELFEYIKRESIKQLIVHLVEHYRERMMAITYVNVFEALLQRYEQLTVYPSGADDSSFTTTQEGTPRRTVNGRGPYSGLNGMSDEEEAYFAGAGDSDDEDDVLPTTPAAASPKHQAVLNGASPLRPLVSYPDDEDEAMDILASSPDVLGNHTHNKKSSDSLLSSDDDDAPRPFDSSDASTGEGEGGRDEAMDENLTSPPSTAHLDHVEDEDKRGRSRQPVPLHGSPGHRPFPPDSPPEPLSAKKRSREDEDEDELGKMMGSGGGSGGAGGVKRRNSSALSGHGTSAIDGSVEVENGGGGRNHEHHLRPHSGTAPLLANSETESGPHLPGSVSYNSHALLPQQQQQQRLQQQQQQQQQPILRRKGSLKTRNESSHVPKGLGNFAVKAVAGAKKHIEGDQQDDDPGGQKQSEAQLVGGEGEGEDV